MPAARITLEHMDASTADAIRDVLVEEGVREEAIQYPRQHR